MPLTLTPRRRLALRLLAVAASLPLFAQIASPRPACAAEAQAAASPAAPSLKLFPDSRLVTTDRISVEVVGSGPDVVLIPGLASSRETYRRTAERLRGRYRLHLVQVAGFAGEPARGNAQGSAGGAVFLPTTEAVDAYIRGAGLHRPAVVGHSLGGLMALELALDHPADVGRVMVVDALPFYTEVFAGPAATVAMAQAISQQMGAQLLAADQATYLKGTAGTAAGMVTAPADRERLQGWMAATDRPVMVRAMQEDMTTDLRPRMKDLAVPVSVIYEAALGPLVQADYAPVRQKTLTPAAANAKHFVMYDDPAGFDAALDAFLAG